jgi:DNA-binding XRE family transcriptional regulator
MISRAVVIEVRRWLAESCLTQEEIAARVGVSKGTVNAISRGLRPERPPRLATSDDEERLDDADRPPPQRCRGCGGMVYLPCLLCRLRKIAPRKREGPRSRPVARG